MFKLFKYFKKSDWLFTALLIVIVALQVNLDLMLPDLMGDIVGFIQYNALYEEPLREILRTGGLMLLVVAGGGWGRGGPHQLLAALCASCSAI